MAHAFLKFSDRVAVIPVIHGSGDFALEVRRVMLEEAFDCLAVPLPPSFRRHVEEAVGHLPAVTMVAEAEPVSFNADTMDDEDDSEIATVNYVPVDPCQGVIAAVRVAIEERIPRAFVDLEVEHFHPYAAGFPDPYALKKVPLARFAAALLPAIPRPREAQRLDRIAHMASRLHGLETKHRSVLFVCSMLDWPWVREAYTRRTPPPAEDVEVEATTVYQPQEKTLLFMLGELPFITGLYERARSELEDDEHLSVDGVKELLITARDRYKKDLKKQARPITPQLLSLYMRYVRNLALVGRRLTPDLYTLTVAAQQFAGDPFALHVVETARHYPFHRQLNYPRVSLGIDRARLPDGGVVRTVNRLAGPPLEWRGLELRRRPERKERRKWEMRWNPFQQCSWPPEDVVIERFRIHTFDRARAVMGQDLAKVEKFTTSVMDGVDIRETLRNWHTNDIYVKNYPPSRGNLDAVVMLFDSPADPRDYPYRVTWMAEHAGESTLAFFATDWRRNVVGPGVAQATYGGALMIYPPIYIPDVWRDRFFDRVDTMEERLLMAACVHSAEKHVALLSPAPPGAAWRKMAKQFGKKWVHLPLGGFSASTVQQLRVFHVLNGKQVRSYAAEFIRKA